MKRYERFTSAPIPSESNPMLNSIVAEYGFVPNLIRGLAPSPDALHAYDVLSKAFTTSSLTPEEQQIILLTVSRLNECEYCTSAHSMAAEQTDLEWSTVENVRNREPLSNERYEALRTFTERVANDGGRIPRDAWTEFTNAGFDERNAIDVVLGVTLKTLTNTVNELVETPLDPAYAKRRWTVGMARVANA